MAKVKFTDRWIEAAKAVPGRRVEHTDAITPGLQLRITPRGVKSFSVLARRDVLVRRTLGRYPIMSLADARRKAMDVLREMAEPASPPAAPVMTFGALVDDYVRLHLERTAKSWKNARACLNQDAVHSLRPRDAASIEKREIVAILDGLVEAGKPHAGVNLLKNLKAMYNWALDRDVVIANPCDRIRPPVKTTQRDRVLSDAEIVAVLGACDSVPKPFGDIVQILLHVGCRRNEASE